MWVVVPLAEPHSGCPARLDPSRRQSSTQTLTTGVDLWRSVMDTAKTDPMRVPTPRELGELDPLPALDISRMEQTKAILMSWTLPHADLLAECWELRTMDMDEPIAFDPNGNHMAWCSQPLGFPDHTPGRSLAGTRKLDPAQLPITLSCMYTARPLFSPPSTASKATPPPALRPLHSVPTPAEFNPDDDHYDTTRVAGYDLPKVITHTAFTRQLGIEGQDIARVSLLNFLHEQWNSWWLRHLAHGGEVRIVVAKSMPESVFAVGLLSQIRQRHLDLDALALHVATQEGTSTTKPAAMKLLKQDLRLPHLPTTHHYD